MGVIENMKDVAELVKKFGDIDLNRRILTLENEVLDLSRDKRRADEKAEELEQALKFKEKLTFRTPFYYLEGDPEPYCPGCWESKKAAIHVQINPMTARQMQCPACKHLYRRVGII
jgi:hypothetical protein